MKEGAVLLRTRTPKKNIRRKKVRCKSLVKYEYKKPMTCLNDIKIIVQQSMKEKGITREQARKSIGIKRYEK